jgi:hypothetical protein
VIIARTMGNSNSVSAQAGHILGLTSEVSQILNRPDWEPMSKALRVENLRDGTYFAASRRPVLASRLIMQAVLLPMRVGTYSNMIHRYTVQVIGVNEPASTLGSAKTSWWASARHFFGDRLSVVVSRTGVPSIVSPLIGLMSSGSPAQLRAA